MQSLLKDVAYAWRTLRSNPAFSLTAIITLALGIGASTAIFSVVNAVLLRPLPYGDAGRLTLIWGDMVKRDVKDFPFPPGDLPDLRQRGLPHGDRLLVGRRGPASTSARNACAMPLCLAGASAPSLPWARPSAQRERSP